MSGIEQYLNNILSARYGKDVRQSIHDAIEQSYTDATLGFPIQPTLVTADNYTDILPDLNDAKEDKVYRLNFSSEAVPGINCSDNLPKGLPNGNIITLMVIRGTTPTNNPGITHLLFSTEGIYYRWTTAKNTGSEWVTVWGDWYLIAKNYDDLILTYHVNKSYTDSDLDGTHFKSLTKAIMNVQNHENVTIYVYEGTYDIISEIEEAYGTGFLDTNNYDGLALKNNVHIIFSSKAKVVCHYKGDRQYTLTTFSPFTAGGNHGFILENLNIDVSRCRYCVHDERGLNTDMYRNVYLNCNMKLDNSDNPQWNSTQCIGGGLGTNGEIIIKDSIFEGINTRGEYEKENGVVTYHNSAADGAKSKIVMSGCYIKGKGTARFSYYGQSEEITEVLVTGNSFGSSIVSRAETSDGSSPNVNISIIDFNNEIRNE